MDNNIKSVAKAFLREIVYVLIGAISVVILGVFLHYAGAFADFIVSNKEATNSAIVVFLTVVVVLVFRLFGKAIIDLLS